MQVIMASGIEELKALFSSIANQLFISEANAENVICKMSGAGVWLDWLSPLI